MESKQPVKRFEDLLVWQMSRELVKEIYSISNLWRDRSLQDQIRRASVSVMSNIAEGFERGTKDEFLYFLYISRGSVGEVRSQLYIAIDQRFLSQVDFARISDRADHVARLLYKLIESYKKKSYGGQRYSSWSEKTDTQFDTYLKSMVEKGKK